MTRRKATPSSSRSAAAAPIDLDERFAELRQGARNVAGVTYQAVVTALAVCGAAPFTDVTSARPEGFEDCDCELRGGGRLLVQAKDRAPGTTLGLSAILDAVDHAAPVLVADTDARFVLVTDAELPENVAPTGREQALSDVLADRDAAAREIHCVDVATASDLLRRSHLVQIPWGDGQAQARRRLEETGRTAPALAALAYSRLLHEVMAVASAQREKKTPREAVSLTPQDAAAVVQHVKSMTDPESLRLAERLGIVEPVDFTRPVRLPYERFLLGVDVVPGHIAAGLDVLRVDELLRIFDGISTDRYVVLAGPSGVGKSALLWRAAYELAGKFRLVRVRRVHDEDVGELRRYIELQEPTAETPVLVCVDNLGRPSTSGWESAADVLLELPGVFLIGAVRSENVSASLLRARARIVSPTVDARLAYEVAAQLQDRGIQLRTEVDDALKHADGLLMEFVALLYEGRRLDDIISAQIDARVREGRTTEVDVLRLVCEAHLAAVALEGNALAQLTGHPPDLRAALEQLKDEFLVVETTGGAWSGLHELRSAVASTAIHATPPPTEGVTVAQLLGGVAPGQRSGLIVQAGLRKVDPNPVVVAAQELVRDPKTGAAAVLELLEAFLRLDAFFQAAIYLNALMELRPPKLALEEALLVALTLRETGERLNEQDLPNAAAVNALADSLPRHDRELADEVADAVIAGDLIALAAGADAGTRLALLEAAAVAGVGPVPGDLAQGLYRTCRGSLEHDARLVAALAHLTRVDASRASGLFGPLDERVFRVGVESEDVVKIELREPDTVAIWIGDPDVYDLGALLANRARLTLDLCPEVNDVRLLAVDPLRRPSLHPDSQKQFERHSFPNPALRPRKIRLILEEASRLLAVQTAGQRAGAERELVDSMQELLERAPRHLLDAKPNARRRREWINAAHVAEIAVAHLPLPPFDPDDTSHEDAFKRVLGMIATALRRIADAVAGNTTPPEVGTAAPLRDALEQIRREREVPSKEAGAPKASARSLDLLGGLVPLIALLADLVLALGEAPQQAATRRRGEDWTEAARRIIDDTRGAVLDFERAILTSAVSDAAHCHVVEGRSRDAGRLVRSQWIVTVPSGHFGATVDAILNALDEGARERLAFRVIVVPTADSVALPTHARVLGTETAFPVDAGEVATLLSEIGVAVVPPTELADTISLVHALVAASRAASYLHMRAENGLGADEQTREAYARLNEARGLAARADRRLQDAVELAVSHIELEILGQAPFCLAAGADDFGLGDSGFESLLLTTIIDASAAFAVERLRGIGA